MSSAKLFTLVMQEPWKDGLPAAAVAVGCLARAILVHPSLLPSILSLFRHSRSSDPSSPGLNFFARLLNLVVAEATCPQAGPILHLWAASQPHLHY